jgi:hypothetical protein
MTDWKREDEDTYDAEANSYRCWQLAIAELRRKYLEEEETEAHNE